MVSATAFQAEDVGSIPVTRTYLGLHVPRLAFLPCKERVEGSIPFGSTIARDSITVRN